MHKVLLFSSDFATPTQTNITHGSHDIAVMGQRTQMLRPPVTTADQAAMRAKLYTAIIEPILLRVNIQCDTKRMVTEAGTVTLAVDLTACHADTVTDYLKERLILLLEYLQGVLYNWGDNPADVKRSQTRRIDLDLVFLANGTAGIRINFVGLQFSVGVRHGVAINRLFQVNVPFICLISTSGRC